MDRRSYLITASVAISVPVVGCIQAPSDTQNGHPDRPWEESEPIDNPDGVHDLVVENHTTATNTAWLRVVREAGSTLIDGRYELPDGRGIEFEDLADWERKLTIDLAIEGVEVVSLEWKTAECGPDSEASGERGSRDATVRVNESANTKSAPHISLEVDECDAIYGPGLPTGPAEGFRLDD